MQLHAPQRDSTWKGNPKPANFWQRLASQTNSIVTPGNVLSVTGLLSVIWGAWQIGGGEHWVLGVVLVAVGRFFDVLDGYAAELTHTKSHLGAAIDVICDKIAMIAIVIAAVWADLAWPWFLALLLLYTVYLAYFGMLWGRTYRIYPNTYAKLASFVSWIAIFLSVFHSKEPSVWFAISASVVIGLWAVLAGLALRAYHHELDKAMQTQRPTGDWAKEVTRLICISNQRSTHYHQAHTLLIALGNAMHKAPQEITIAKHEPAIKKMLASSTSRDKILIAVAGGDGTVNTVINTLIRLQGQYETAECVVLPLWGGNANDFAYMLNGLRMFAQARRLITRTALVAVPLIKLEVEEPRRPARTMYASCYASFGATAYAARQLESHRFSTKKLLYWLPPLLVGREIVAVVKALVAAPQYSGEIDDKQQVFYEHSLINGSRIAKINRVPVKLTQPYFLHATITRKDVSAIVSLLRIGLGKPAAEYTTRNRLSFKLVTPVDAQIDGEVMHLPAGTQITASSVRTELRFASTKLR